MTERYTCKNCSHFPGVHKSGRCTVKGCRCPKLELRR